jgi:hypothetical protein
MQRSLRTIIISALALGLSAAVWAHGGFDHVMGTVSKLDANVLTVNTGKSNVIVKLNDKTEIMLGDHKASAADLKVGVRVVVDIPEGSKDKIAASVKIGGAAVAVGAAADHHEHDAHK